MTSAAEVSCRVTLEGSFHSRTIPKVSRQLIGAITRAIVARPCSGGEAWADNGTEAEPLGTAPNRLPFHLTYEFFTGTLPNINALGVLLSRFSFVIQATVLGISARCRYGNATDNVTGSAAREAGGGITSSQPWSAETGQASSTAYSTAASAPPQAPLAGTSGAITGLTNTNIIRITLI